MDGLVAILNLTPPIIPGLSLKLHQSNQHL